MPTLGPRRCQRTTYQFCLERAFWVRDDHFRPPEKALKLPRKGEIWSVKTPLPRFVEVLEDVQLPEGETRLSKFDDVDSPAVWRSFVHPSANDHRLRVKMWHPAKDEEQETTVALGNFEQHIDSPLGQLAALGL